jgi:Na+-transporting NADH:ubiquinone oxidoreductase subunit A
MFYKNKKPSYIGNNKIIFLNKGFNIKIKGAAAKSFFTDTRIESYSIQPGNFNGIAPIPYVEVNIGDKVKAGDVLFYDKKKAEIKFVSPVSGIVKNIIRGDRRSIKEIVIAADSDIQYKNFNPPDITSCERNVLVDFFMESGIWPLIKQRPYNLIPDKNIIPKNIFISTFDSSPLAPDYDFIIQGNGDEFQKGIDVLSKLTEGKVYLGLNANKSEKPSDIFVNAIGAEKTYFKGPHPSGNVGVQVHHTAPIKGNDKIWVLGIQEVVTIGKMFLDSIYNTERIIAVTGEEVLGTKYLKTFLGAEISGILKSCLKDENCRVVSGNVLHGESKKNGEFMNAFDYQISVISEGDYFESFGWLVSEKTRPTFSKSFLNVWFSPRKKLNVDTNIHGQERAFVASGIYEEVLPMDIYPVFLMKSILAGDIERMEGLGINELSEEDLALCEFICPSKQEFKQILRDGHEMMIEQGF